MAPGVWRGAVAEQHPGQTWSPGRPDQHAIWSRVRRNPEAVGGAEWMDGSRISRAIRSARFGKVEGSRNGAVLFRPRRRVHIQGQESSSMAARTIRLAGRMFARSIADESRDAPEMTPARRRGFPADAP